ncbi:MAG: FAD-dependent oxidoreductase [Burkholderiaceae bacterium]
MEFQGEWSKSGAESVASMCDVLVVGSGASGLTTAITARLNGLDVRVVERETLIGGSTAVSYGTLWIPCNPIAGRLGIADDPEAALTYLRHETGRQFDEARLRAYLAHAPRMIDFLESHSDARFLCREDFPDHRPELPGASQGGRTIVAAPYDGKRLGESIRLLRPPMASQTFLGMMYTPQEVRILQTATRSLRSFGHVARRLVRHAWETARHGRALWLTNGNALAARLLRTTLELGIPVWTGAPMQRLLVERGRVCGAVVERAGRMTTVRARRGVVLACGGFGWNRQWCSELFERPQLDGANWSLATPGNMGDGLRAALDAGGQLQRDVQTAGFWAPVSRSAANDRELAGHFHDRHRAGFLAVDAGGRRFANESGSNHHFAEAIVRAALPGDPPLAWLICDHASLRRTGCGEFIAPRPARLAPHLRAGYLLRAGSIEELAGLIHVPADEMRRTVDRFNQSAREGGDPQFGKGRNSFDRYYADPRRRPNGCVGPLGAGPYYAVRMTAGHMGTLVGLRTDLAARVLDVRRRPIPGLHAVGNDMANPFGGACPGGGITLGPGMTFGYLAARHLAGLRDDGIELDERPAPEAAFPA